ncbi:MAG: GNAT family N-acetyltransferase, partial [Acidimicrobiia bacterium]
VTVFPTHRRMGVMRGMMERHLDAAAEADYPVAALWASETSIYDRFGYGVATKGNEVEMRGPTIQFRNSVPSGQVERVTLEKAKDTLPPIFDRFSLTTPGMFGRNEAWWANEVLADDEWMKRQRTAIRVVAHRGEEGHDGYAIYRQKSDGTPDGHANGSIDVSEVVAETPDAHASLWSYLTNIDGYPIVKYWAMPVDDPLPLIVTEPRRVHTTRQWDALWVRILDVEAALSSRSYERDGSLTFSVVDPFRPSTDGVYTLDIVDGIGTCTRSANDAELDVDIDVLGALFLGGANAVAYGAAGRIRGESVAVSELNAVCRTGKQPWCPEIF